MLEAGKRIIQGLTDARIYARVDVAMQAAWDELERQAQEPRAGTPYVDRDVSLIDGEVDMRKVVQAIVEVLEQKPDMC